MANKKNIKKWVTALRSGEYCQGRRSLRFQDKFCCLGVACELALKSGVDLEVIHVCGIWNYDEQTGHLPKKVQNWLGIQEKNPVLQAKLRSAQISAPAAVLNDQYEASFDEIADAIERTYSQENLEEPGN